MHLVHTTFIPFPSQVHALTVIRCLKDNARRFQQRPSCWRLHWINNHFLVTMSTRQKLSGVEDTPPPTPTPCCLRSHLIYCLVIPLLYPVHFSRTSVPPFSFYFQEFSYSKHLYLSEGLHAIFPCIHLFNSFACIWLVFIHLPSDFLRHRFIFLKSQLWTLVFLLCFIISSPWLHSWYRSFFFL